ncbi:metal ABC transporter permease, partial [Bacillus subtilis]|uniref:metal ABC transporter permease n=1 Tax=Bacillus subtilis TaxID=1423 RepID=UPI0016429194
LVGVSCGLMGRFVVVRRMGMVGDGISDTVLVGIVGGFVVRGSVEGICMFMGGGGTGVLTGLLVEVVDRKGVE